MWLLRLFLYSVLATCFLWIFLLFAGPFFVVKFIDYHFDGMVTAEKVKVTNKLDLEIGSLYYELDQFANLEPLKGFTRAVRINWSVFSKKPGINVKLGPSVVRNFGKFESASFTLSSQNGFSLNHLDLGFEANEMGLTSGLSVKKLNLSGHVDETSRSLNEVTFTLDSPLIQSLNFSSPYVNGSINSLDLSLPMSQQVSTTNINVGKFKLLNSEFKEATAIFKK